MIEYKIKNGEPSFFAASGTPGIVLADMGFMIQNVAFALAQGGVPAEQIKANIAMIATTAADRGIKKV